VRALLLVAIVSAALAAGKSARAQATPDAQARSQIDLQRELHTYFDGEKREGVAFLGAGITAFGAGAVLFSRRTAFARGVAWPVVSIGVIQTAAGIIVHSRTDAQVARLDAQLATDPMALRASELARMQRVDREFVLLKWAELGLAAAGVGVTTIAIAAEEETLEGVGVGLTIQSTAMLLLDLFAAERASTYTDALERFQVNWAPVPHAQAGMFSVSTIF
jgi:hypothetical protein